MQIEQIAYIKSDFSEKFGIPRQSNLADNRAEISFSAKISEYGCAAGNRDV